MHGAELFSLSGKTAVVIGGSGVLGSEIARGLSLAGASVVIVGRTEAKAQRQADMMSQGSRRVLGFPADATKKADLYRVLDLTLDAFGSVDILLNAAGVNSGTPFFDICAEEWERVLDVNLRSVFLACQVFGKWMIDAGGGRSIINVSSASSDPPLSRVFTYGIAKAGVNQITKYLACEWAPHKVRVNAIVPGFFPAEQNRALLTEDRVNAILRHTPMKRFGDPSEVIGAAIYLASERASSFVTGAILRVDGGFGAMTI